MKEEPGAESVCVLGVGWKKGKWLVMCVCEYVRM